MRLQKAITILIFFLISIASNAQKDRDNTPNKSAQKDYSKVIKYLKKNDNNKGSSKLEDFIKKYPTYINARKKAIQYYMDKGNVDDAVLHLEALIAMNPTDAGNYMKLAYVYEQASKFPLAIQTLSSVDKRTLETNEIEKLSRYEDELRFRKEAYANPVKIDLVKLGPEINTDKLEYLPTLNAAETKMVFVSRKYSTSYDRTVNEDLYEVILKNGEPISTAQSIEAINTAYDEGSPILSSDGKVLIFASNDKYTTQGNYDLYISFNKEGQWSKPRNMGTNINSRSLDSQPALSQDGRTLYFSSTRPGGKGGADIWKVELGTNNSWGKAINLGEPINTSGDEESPFLHQDEETLYFRSDEHIGLGDFDIFMSKVQPDSTWGAPINLGYPINTKGSEGALTVNLSGSKAYYATDSNEGQVTAVPQLDLYTFSLPEHLLPEPVTYIKLLITDAETNKPVSATIKIIDLISQEARQLNTSSQGELTSMVRPGNYAVAVNKQNYSFHSENIVFDSIRAFVNPFEYNIGIHKIKAKEKVAIEKQSTPIVLNNIFFATGDYRLQQESTFEISELAKMLLDNQQIRIKIIGHTDNVGTTESNLILSQNRAKAVYEALLNLRIEKSRLLYEGMGSQQPIADNGTELGRKTNRRTEFVIIN